MTALEQELLALFARGVAPPLPDAEFDRLALAVFAYQFERNSPYARLCRNRSRTPETVGTWTEIPALPTDAFKFADLTTVPPEHVRVTYLTSGTTRAGETRGRHLLPDTRLYDAALLPNFRAHVLPDLDRVRFLVCGPIAEHFPNSSLGHMHSRVVAEWGAPGSGVFWFPEGPRFPELAAALAAADAERMPVCLLGTAFGFVHFLDWLQEEGRRFDLPPGARLMDTGGYKGRSRSVPKGELYALYEARLGIPQTHIVNEYGMTELGSQFYDTILRDYLRQPATRNFRSTACHQPEGMLPGRRKVPLPWVRTQVVDPETLAPLPDGEVGLLKHVDLANLHSVVAVQTDDLGVGFDGGFEVLGRAAGAEPRGCSLAVEAFLASR